MRSLVPAPWSAQSGPGGKPHSAVIGAAAEAGPEAVRAGMGLFDPVVGIGQLPGGGTPRQGHGVFQSSQMPGRQREGAQAQLWGLLGYPRCPSAGLAHSTQQPILIPLVSNKSCLSSWPLSSSRPGVLVHVWM